MNLKNIYNFHDTQYEIYDADCQQAIRLSNMFYIQTQVGGDKIIRDGRNSTSVSRLYYYNEHFRQ